MSAESTIDADALARAIIANLPRVPLEHALWNAEQCAAHLGGQSVKTFERTQHMKDFPAPRFVPSKVWPAAAVIEWGERQYAKIPKARRQSKSAATSDADDE